MEIDLLRGGHRLPMSGSLPPGDYHVYIGRIQRKPRCQVLGWPWRRPLPSIPIPLLPEDNEAKVDLQGIFRRTYEQAYYDQRLPYGERLVPVLPDADAAWVGERLKERGLA